MWFKTWFKYYSKRISIIFRKEFQDSNDSSESTQNYYLTLKHDSIVIQMQSKLFVADDNFSASSATNDPIECGPVLV